MIATLSVVSSTVQAPTAGVGLRWARAVALAATAWCTASAAHLSGGGRSPAVPIVVVVVALTAWPLTFSLRGRASGLRLVTLLGVGQAAMHAAFVVIGDWGAPTALQAPGMPAHPGHASLASASSMPGMPGTAEHAMSLLPSPVMVLAHACAAVLLGCVLASGERALFSLIELLVQLARPAVRICSQVLRVLAALLSGDCPTQVETAAVTRSRGAPGPMLPQHLLVRAVLWRGPPHLRAA